MSERETILGRIREALRVHAPFPGHAPHEEHSPAVAQPHPPTDLRSESTRQWLPAVGETFEDRVELFKKNAVDLKAAFHLVSDSAQLLNLLHELQKAEGWKKIGAHNGELTNLACQRLALPVCSTDQPYKPGDLEKCDVALTECDALIAQTGSVLVTSGSAGGRALSILPPHHVVLARREQLIRDLSEAFALLKKNYSANYPSFISFITGPSRTGDIERILVLGAHGPKKLTILCV